jgi:hypothetical protein
MQLAAGMQLKAQCVNAVPQELYRKMALIYSDPHFLTQWSCCFERKIFLLFITEYIM